MSVLDAVVVGAGPNGLAAAITLARAGRSVHVIEANEVIGGGVRSTSTGPGGFVHDTCSAVYPLGIGSPFLRSLPLAAHGLEWVQPEVPLAHPLEDGRAAFLARSLEETMAGLQDDGRAYADITNDLIQLWRRAADEADACAGAPHFSSLRSLKGMTTLLRALPLAVRSAQHLMQEHFRTVPGEALIAGLGAHGMQPLTTPFTASFVLSLGAAAHAVGWPIVRGGAHHLAAAMAAVLRDHGGSIETGRRITSINDLPPSRVILLDVNPAQLATLAADRLPPRYLARLARVRHGPSTFKIDYILERPIPWTADACRRAGVVHVGGDAGEIGAAMSATDRGIPSRRPFVIVAQPSLFDRTRVPSGSPAETAWAYCHVPRGCREDFTTAIEEQIERFAPGFVSSVRVRRILDSAAFEAHNQNLDGGDIGGGACDWRQILFGPSPRFTPWTTPNRQIYLCSASTPPGPGVHGLCGHLAARAALRALVRETDAR